MWHKFFDQFEFLSELMQKFDLLCLKTESDEMPADVVQSTEEGIRLFYVPSLLKKQDDETVCKDQTVASQSKVILYIDFNGFLPEGIFYRLVVRLLQWSQNRKGYEPRLFYQRAKLFVDESHEMIVRILPEKRSCIEVTIKLATVESCSDEEDEEDDVELDPATCKMLWNLLDEHLQYLGRNWMKRISYGFYIPCKFCKNTDCLKLERCIAAKKCVLCNETHKGMRIKRIKYLFGECRTKTEPLLLSNAGQESPKGKKRKNEKERRQHKKQKVSGITINDFKSMLLVVSDYWKKHGNISMLKVLLRQFKCKVGVGEIEKKDDVISLFELLIGSGDCSCEEFSVIFEAVKICGLDGVYRKIKQIESFDSFPFKDSISTFSVYRRKLIKFGKNLKEESIQKIVFFHQDLNVHDVDKWHLILALEDKGIIKDDERSMNDFVKSLRKIGLNNDADILEKPL
ncbi:uncharacterized protein LOC117110453 [Anneissia japonica]|uniref:uncharacterized protein LOC117110453 n=1 Tax=Anneissia japonica TaxID=1529436 RepID=UPI0014256C52|nr:uncharacterized protein LOC117110453 [Anneissia japonica]